ncbi:MAG: hypothetical protein ABJB12_16930 [Pseudomonadota bacterium]
MAISGIRGEQPIFERAPEPVPLAVKAAPSAGAFSKALRGLAREIDVGEKQVASASQLHSYDAASLIALQTGIYRYTEAVDLASKIVDRATNGVRTVLQGGGH